MKLDQLTKSDNESNIFQEASIRGRKYNYEELSHLYTAGAIDSINSSYSLNAEDSLFDSNGSYRDPMDENDINEFLR